jgi:putative ABC transport system substrate-binding protein
MNRRAFIGSLSIGILPMPYVARAQLARKVYRIGILSSAATTSEMTGPQPRSRVTSALLQGLRELGYVYGEHFVTEPRGSDGGPERFPDLATELVRLQVDVIVAAGPTLPALKRATSTIPIVTTGAGDPVGQGYAQSLGRPGGNITGLSIQSRETSVKRLELLNELVPGAAALAVLWDPRFGVGYWQAVEAAARERGWKLLSLEARDAGDIERAFKAATGANARGLLVFAGALFDLHARRIAALAAKHRLPAMYAFRSYVEAGGLISYGADPFENGRRAAVFVDKILKGAKPADLPFEQPTKFELVINLKAARSIGLAIPQLLLSRADEVMQ